MKTRILHSLIVLSALSALVALPSRAGDTLWSLDFKQLKPGDPLASESYLTPPCTGPQSTTVDAQNTLTGAKSVGPLSPALLFTKGSTSHYMPAMTLKASGPFTTGIITLNVDLVFNPITPSAGHPVETLMAFPFLDGDGGTKYVLMIASTGPGSLILGGEGLQKTGGKPLSFSTGVTAHLKAVLDLNQHTFQAFLDDLPMNPPEHDDAKFSSFLGLTIRDGTALGGNNGATFTAGIANLVITHS